MNYTTKLLFVILFVVGIFGYALWQKGYFSTIEPVQATSVVKLQDGDTFNLTATPVKKQIGGRTYTGLAYNGSIPGPIIRVPQGANVTINFKNDTDLPAALHSHGVRMNNAFDGAPPLTQEEIEPRGTFTYKLKFPDAGVYWYHPHVAEVFEQPLGLYGAFVVEPADAEYYPPVNREEVLFLSDLPIENGKIELDPKENDHSLMGHYGNVMLLNGQEKYVFEAKRGEVVRFFVINAANVRPFKFAFRNVKMKLIGGDSGAYEQATWQDSIVLSPSERAIVDVLFTESTTIVNDAPVRTTVLGSVSLLPSQPEISYAAEFNILQENNATKASIDPFRFYFDKPLDKELTLALSMAGMGSMQQNGMMGRSMMMGTNNDGIEWEDSNEMMSHMSTTETIKWKLIDKATGKENMLIDWSFPRNLPVKIRIRNDLQSSMHPMQHPIHFHGQRFLLLNQNGEKTSNLVWKDTVLVPAGQYVDILLDPSNPGEWMAHCHIAEHLEAGMMMKFTVE